MPVGDGLIGGLVGDLIGYLPPEGQAEAHAALAAIDRALAPAKARFVAAGPAGRALRPAELDWATPAELDAVAAAQERLRLVLAPVRSPEAARARVEAKRAARRAAAALERPTHAITCDMDEDCTCGGRPPVRDLTPVLQSVLRVVDQRGGTPDGLGVTAAVLAQALWPDRWRHPWSKGSRNGMKARATGLLRRLERLGFLVPAVYGWRLAAPLKS